LKVEIEQRRLVFEDVFEVEEAVLRYERSDGAMSAPVRRLSVERGDSVAAVLVDRVRATVILAEQFRYPAWAKGGGWLIETIAGMVDPGESPEQALRREVEEEAGYRIDALTHLSTFFLSPGGSSERIFLYCAFVENSQRVGSGGGMASEHEDIRLLEIPLAELGARLARGDFADAKTLIGLQWLDAHRAQVVA
jgi:ADP-ribose pyrophosphatase